MSTLTLSSPRITPAWRDAGIIAAVLLGHVALLASLNATRPQPVQAPQPLTVQLLTPAPLQAAPQPAAAVAPPAATPAVTRPLPRPEPRPVVRPKPQAQATPSPTPTSRQPAPDPLPRTTAAAAPAPTQPGQSTATGSATPTTSGNTTSQSTANSNSQSTTPAEVVQPNTRASYLQNPKPPYPPASKRNGDTGTVLLRVMVDAKGNAQDVTLRKSSGYPELDQSALDTVRRWRFVPGKRNGEATAMSVTVPIAFHLKS